MMFGWWRRRRQEADRRAAQRLEDVRLLAASSSGVDAFRIVRVYQVARRGTKAVVRNDRTGHVRDAWFWWARVIPGQLVVVGASTGWGPHTARDNVLYIGSERDGPGIYASVDGKTLTAAARHYNRAARS